MPKSTLFSLLLLPVLLSGCNSYYSSAILGHEAICLSPPDGEEKGVRTEGGLFLKTSPTWSQYTSDYTHSLQAGFIADVALPLGDSVEVQGGGGISGYGSLTFMDDPTESEGEAVLSSWGVTGQGLIRIFMGEGKTRFSLGAEGVYNREWGEYGEFRRSLAESSPSRLNLSPSGNSFSYQFKAGVMQWWPGKGQIHLETGGGYALADLFPEESADGDSPDWLILYSLSLSYRNSMLWSWISLDTLSFLNRGVSLGVGFFLN